VTLTTNIEESWAKDVVPTLSDYITIPNVSMAYGPTGRRTATWTRRSS
jgi:hypothetical protein